MVQEVEKIVEVPQVVIQEVIKEVVMHETQEVIREVPVPQIQEVVREVLVPQVQYVEKIVDVPQIRRTEKLVEVPETQVIEVIRHVLKNEVEEIVREVPSIQVETMERVVEVPEIRYEEVILEKVEHQVQEVLKHVPKVEVQEVVREVPRVHLQTVEKIVSVPQVQHVEKIVEVPEIQVRYLPAQEPPMPPIPTSLPAYRGARRSPSQVRSSIATPLMVGTPQKTTAHLPAAAAHHQVQSSYPSTWQMTMPFGQMPVSSGHSSRHGASASHQLPHGCAACAGASYHLPPGSGSYAAASHQLPPSSATWAAAPQMQPAASCEQEFCSAMAQHHVGQSAYPPMALSQHQPHDGGDIIAGPWQSHINVPYTYAAADAECELVGMMPKLWSADNTFCLCGEDELARYANENTAIIDPVTTSSVTEAVDLLNSGALPCDEGWVVVFSRSCKEWYVVYQSGLKDAALVHFKGGA
jgi:hypothetical protein